MTAYKVVAFDAYGTLLDVYSMGVLAEKCFPGHGEAVSQMWRDRQIDYTRLVTLSDPSEQGSRFYLPFGEITRRALRYVCKRLGLVLTAATEASLMAQYAKLTAFADALPVLQAVKARGISTAILSNGDGMMLAEVAASNGLSDCLDKILTVDAIRRFKTAPQSYALLEKTFAVDRADILFVSSNAWDAVGAGWFGLDVFWVNRAGHPFEEIGPAPRYTGPGLGDVLAVLG